ncbi:MAG: hypothetical protein P8129_12630 [Anaerolineae bacterium]
MNRSKTKTILFLLVVVSLGFLPGDSTNADPGPAVAPAVTVRAASGATIGFWTQNGLEVDSIRPEKRNVPHLVLRRNGVLTSSAERTLVVEVAGLDVPPSGVTVTLRVETQRGDPDRAGESPPRIEAWRASRWIANATRNTRPGVRVVFRHEFAATVRSDAGVVGTPTDYLRYELVVTDGRRLLHTLHKDHALLLENQWVVPLPEVLEAAPGAAPDEMVVYYRDMAPFRRDTHDASTQVPRARVSDYLRSELIPAMIEAFRVQTDDWGFPWFPEWMGHRRGQDTERLSVALADGEAWYHGQTLGRGNASIFLNVNGGMVEYETLTDGLLSTFHHELFHNHQRNIHQHLGGSGHVAGAEGAWAWFAEGMAVLASAVGQPGVQFSRTWGARSYLFNAQGFIGRAGISEGDLNQPYARMNPYHAAAYWRFLYDQCGGRGDDGENPAAGMAVIRQVLTALFGGDVVDVSTSTDLVQQLPAIMDVALRDSACPFGTYQDSLLAFSSALYALRLDGARCRAPGLPAVCGFYDPQTPYHEPPASTLTYRGEALVYSAAEQAYPAGIPSSFGIDLVEVELDAAADGASLALEIHGAPGAEAEFQVQLWRLADEPLSTQGTGPETVERASPEGPFVYVLPQIDTDQYQRLGLIITRVDADEELDRVGAYTIVLRPAS